MTSHSDPRLSLVVVVCSLAGCSVSHDAPVQVQILDVGNSYTVCRGSVIVRRELSLAETTYELQSDGLPDKFVESGVKRFTIDKLDKVEPVTMPSAMPDPDVDLDGNGSRYREGTVYRWDGGLEAVIKNGRWTPIKLTRENQTCASRLVSAIALPDIRKPAAVARTESELLDEAIRQTLEKPPVPVDAR
jgi:hypothetical protein